MTEYGWLNEVKSKQLEIDLADRGPMFAAPVLNSCPSEVIKETFRDRYGMPGYGQGNLYPMAYMCQQENDPSELGGWLRRLKCFTRFHILKNEELVGLVKDIDDTQKLIEDIDDTRNFWLGGVVLPKIGGGSHKALQQPTVPHDVHSIAWLHVLRTESAENILFMTIAILIDSLNYLDRSLYLDEQGNADLDKLVAEMESAEKKYFGRKLLTKEEPIVDEMPEAELQTVARRLDSLLRRIRGSRELREEVLRLAALIEDDDCYPTRLPSLQYIIGY